MMKEISTTISEQIGGAVKLGNVYGKQFGTGYAGNVWDINYFCPTIRTCQGGGNQPMIIVSERNDNTNRRFTEKSSRKN